jgi:hypothetical protein
MALEFIKNCLYYFLMSISAAYNPEGMKFKRSIIGIVAMFILLGLIFGILWLIAFF